VQYVPDTVEELDLSYCPSIEFEGRAKYPIYPSLMWQHSALAVKWPASLRALKLTGIKSATAALFSTRHSPYLINAQLHSHWSADIREHLMS
jgi:hypothetical protein